MRIMIIYLMFILLIKNIVGRSDEFNNCVNADRTISSISDCTRKKICYKPGCIK